jgi:SsrA-binding protein
MKKKDVLRWQKKMKSGGITIVALKGFFDERNRFKLEIGLAKGKKEYDKRQAEKKRSDIKINDEY